MKITPLNTGEIGCIKWIVCTDGKFTRIDAANIECHNNVIKTDKNGGKHRGCILRSTYICTIYLLS